MEEGERIYLKDPSGSENGPYSERDVQNWYREGWLEDNTRVRIMRNGHEWLGSVDRIRKHYGICAPFGPVVRSDIQELTLIQQNISHLRSSFGELKNKDDIANSKYSRTLAQIVFLGNRLQGTEGELKSSASSGNEGSSTSKVTVEDSMVSSSIPSDDPSTSTSPSTPSISMLPEKLPLVEVDKDDMGELAPKEWRQELFHMYLRFVDRSRLVAEMSDKYIKWEFCPCCPNVKTGGSISALINHILCAGKHLAQFTAKGGRVTIHAVDQLRSILKYYERWNATTSNSNPVLTLPFIPTPRIPPVPQFLPIVDIDFSLRAEQSVSRDVVSCVRSTLKKVPRTRYEEMEISFQSFQKYDACPVCFDIKKCIRMPVPAFFGHLASQPHYDKYTAKGGRVTMRCVEFYVNFLTVFIGDDVKLETKNATSTQSAPGAPKSRDATPIASSNARSTFVITVPHLYPLIDIYPTIEEESAVSREDVAMLRSMMRRIPSSKQAEMESAFAKLMRYETCPVCYDWATKRMSGHLFISHLGSESHFEKFTAKGGRATARCVQFYDNFLTAFTGNFEVVLQQERIGDEWLTVSVTASSSNESKNVRVVSVKEPAMQAQEWDSSSWQLEPSASKGVIVPSCNLALDYGRVPLMEIDTDLPGAKCKPEDIKQLRTLVRSNALDMRKLLKTYKAFNKVEDRSAMDICAVLYRQCPWCPDANEITSFVAFIFHVLDPSHRDKFTAGGGVVSVNAIDFYRRLIDIFSVHQPKELKRDASSSTVGSNRSQSPTSSRTQHKSRTFTKSKS